ncbi:MAG: peptidoglycan editing factor PgeF [Deltaproteobacteria bacterium]|nr:peptidoglycan editing factor PgeF [Deltaproteobacteria bacterium]
MHFAFRDQGPVTTLLCPALERYDFIHHAFCTRHTGVSDFPFSSLNISLHVGDDEEKVLHNRDLIADAFQMNAQRFLIIDQVHGDKILVLDEPLGSHAPYESAAFDAMVTDQPDLALSIKTADCVPILLLDKTQRVIGAVHAGWQGTTLKIAAKTVDILVKQFNSKPEDILAVIGPAIGPCCYEVDTRVYNAMAHDEKQKHLFGRSTKNPGKWMFDLPLANKLHILSMGIPEENIFTSDLCTACQTDMFFSHRGERGQTGRQLNFIMLKK